ncbi:diguanylate cyclase domain-containing protein [Marinobacter sp.]|uniref:sensor domain-containing protein n=1 Tax=Marinobacter sp. TaxID=50741 RepID=UPI0035675457
MRDDSFAEALLNNLQEFLDSSPDCLLVSDFDTHRYLYVNETTCTMTGYSRHELLEMEASALTLQDRDLVSEIYQKAREAGDAGFTDEPRLMESKDRSRRGWWEPHFRYTIVHGREVVVIVSREVTPQVLAERAALRAKKIYAALSATNEAIIRSSSPDELFQAVCDAAIESGGMTTAVVLMPDPGSDLLVPRAMAGYGRDAMDETVISTDPGRPEGRGLNGTAFRSCEPEVTGDFLRDDRTRHWHGMVRSKTRLKSAASVPILRAGRAIGTLYLCSRERGAFDEEIINLLLRMADNVSFALQTFEREEERRQAEERAHYLATHCSLTGLPNRNLLADLLEQAIASVDRTGHKPAIMFIDLDHFKEVNDTWGHDTGDRVLEQVASRLRGLLRDHDVLARLGGDEFVVLVQNIDRRAHAVRVAEKLLQASKQPIKVENHAFEITFSIGISLYPDHGCHQRELMKAADLAMYVAKEKGKNTWAISGDGAQSRISCVDEPA